MATHGSSTQSAACAICKKPIPKGSRVYFDATKTKPNCLVHETCWETLLKKRGPKLRAKGTPRPEIQSTVVLDPLF